MPFPTSARRILNGVLFSTLLGVGALAEAQTYPFPEHNRIQVQAQAEISVAPDMATLDARLWERTPAVVQKDDTPSDPQALAQARQRLEQRTAELIRTLEQAGLVSQAINAGSLMVRPDYIQGPSSEGGPGETLVRTQLERPIKLRIDDLAQLPVILDALTQAGVNALEGVTYDLKDRDAASDRALTKALEKARRKAQLIAETLGVEIGRVSNVQENNAPIFAPRTYAMRADTMESKAATEYRPGEITLESTVSVDWDIAK